MVFHVSWDFNQRQQLLPAKGGQVAAGLFGQAGPGRPLGLFAVRGAGRCAFVRAGVVRSEDMRSEDASRRTGRRLDTQFFRAPLVDDRPPPPPPKVSASYSLAKGGPDCEIGC